MLLFMTVIAILNIVVVDTGDKRVKWNGSMTAHGVCLALGYIIIWIGTNATSGVSFRRHIAIAQR